MKKFFLLSLFLIFNYSLLITNCFPQLPTHYYWRIIPSPTQYNLNALTGASSPILILGDNGTLLKSVDQGYTFSIVPGTLNYNLYDIRIDLLGKYTAVGQNGTIYYFTNSSIPTFVLEPCNTTANLHSISGNRSSYSPPVFNRIAVGAGGTIIRSTWNVGTNWSSWSPINSGTVQDLNSIDFYNYSVIVYPYGCIAGNNGLILRTSNFGDNWTIINAGVSNKLNCVRFFDTLNCWITGSNGLLMKSTDRGLNWNIIPLGTTSDLKSISFNPFIVCGSGGKIMQSTNYGINWINTPTPTQKKLNSTSYPLVVGDSGTILHRDIDSSFLFKKLEGNNIRAFINCNGVFDNENNSSFNSGFEWPKGSGKTAIYTAGLSIAAYYQSELREAIALYTGEYTLGRCNNEIPITNDTFKIYSIKRGDGISTNIDWLNWGLMVPYGAPFVDVNNNGTYEPQIDTPGVKGASQTIFSSYTDGFAGKHTPVSGFGGGTLPLYSEVHLTAWCYSQPSYADMQFLEYVIINKSSKPWMKTYFALVSDIDLGDVLDDYVGCDTSRKLAYGYNYDNYDQVYGTAPPAVGFLLLKGAYNKYSNPPKQIDMSSFIRFFSIGQAPPICEAEPYNEPLAAYYYMQGFKKDSTCWLDPTQIPPKKTKFIYTGDPETNIGWTETKGWIGNCNHDSSGQIIVPNLGGDRRLAFSSGAENLTLMPGDTQVIVICQLIAKGSSNLNSVTKLKQLADLARDFYNSGYVIGINKVGNEVPASFRLGQNYPNPFNPITKIKFSLKEEGRLKTQDVKLVIYDITGREIQTLVNEKLQPGTYEVTFDGSNYASGIYFYQLRAGEFIESKKLILLK